MVPGGVMCAPTLTDVTRAWSILEHFRRNWIEPVWLGCAHGALRGDPVATTISWPGSTRSPSTPIPISACYWRMSEDIGLDSYGRGLGRYLSWGYLPHEDKYNRPTIEGRAERRHPQGRRL